MRDLTRRRFLTGTSVLGVTAAAQHALPSAATAGPEGTPPPGAVVIRSGDPRYENLISGYNYRFAGKPAQIHLVGSADQVEEAVSGALNSGSRIAARSGGHCLEAFVTDPQVQVVVDTSRMSRVYFDAGMNAFAVEAGATLGEVYETLFTVWGVTVPGGVCPQVGVGGHVSGGGYGALSRLFGLVVDYLYAVEVVVVDRSGRPSTVVATAQPGSLHRDLWWAHTGGGGGNFGIVTRYWLRGPDPARPGGLPAPPASLLISELSWPRTGLDAARYGDLIGRLIGNYTRWHEENSAPGAPAAGLFATLWCHHIGTADPMLITQMDATVPGAQALLTDFVAAVGEGVTVTPRVRERSLPWLFALRYLSFADFGQAVGKRTKNKSAYLRRSYTEQQIAAIRHHLTRADYRGTSATMLLAGYGGRINSVAPGATAVPQRDSVLKVQYSVSWTDPAEDPAHLGWVREFYRDLFADTGGVPVPGDVADGAYINYPDIDLADPAWNTSGVPWHALYYKDNYPRLQDVKRTWDPGNVFRHALSVGPPG